jgi:excisionase family DNA binding protein
MTTIVKPVTRKATASVAGSRAARPAPEPPASSTPPRRRTVPAARTVLDLTAADQPTSPVTPPPARTPTSESLHAEAPAPPAAPGSRDPGLRPVLSVAEAAALLGVSEWLVLQQIRRGELPHKRCGRRIVLSRDRLLAWLNDD